MWDTIHEGGVVGGLFDRIVWRLLYSSVELADGAHGGEPPNFAVPVCSRVVRLDLGMTSPAGGNRAARPVGSPLVVTLSGLLDTRVVWCATVVRPSLRTQLVSDTSFPRQ